MSVFLDASVLVPVVTDQLSNHPAALECYSRHLEKGKQAFTSAHALAESYATLTALPLRRRISGPEAMRLIEANFLKHLKIIPLNQNDYVKALRLVANLGRVSGQIYDALHVVAAMKAGCGRIYTYNSRHFLGLEPSILVEAPKEPE